MAENIYDTQELAQHLLSIRPSGYISNEFGQYIRQEQERTTILSFAINQKFPFGVRFYGFSASVKFHKVEEILQEVYQLHPNVNWNFGIDSTTFHKPFAYELFGRDFVFNNIDAILVEDDTTFTQVQPYLQQMIDAAHVFLDTNQTLQQFYDLAEAMPIQEMAGFYSQPLPLRRITVKKLLGEPYEEMANTLINKYTQQGRTDDAAFTQGLKNYLDNMQ